MRASILLLLASTAWAEPPYFEDYYSYSRSRGRALHKVEKSKAPACEKHFSKRAQLALSDANREPPAKFTECSCKNDVGQFNFGHFSFASLASNLPDQTVDELEKACRLQCWKFTKGLRYDPAYFNPSESVCVDFGEFYFPPAE